MRKRLAIALASATAAASLAFGAASAFATTTFHCTRVVDHGKIVHVTVKGDKASDALEAHGWTCRS